MFLQPTPLNRGFAQRPFRLGAHRARRQQYCYYPVPLSADTLRPGTVYADPYGHILMIVRRVAQTGDAAGIILAVDGQPDGTVARKRFWRGNFLFAQDPALGLRWGAPAKSDEAATCKRYAPAAQRVLRERDGVVVAVVVGRPRSPRSGMDGVGDNRQIMAERRRESQLRLRLNSRR